MKKIILYLFSITCISAPTLASFSEYKIESQDEESKSQNRTLATSSVTLTGLELNETSKNIEVGSNIGILRLKDRLIVDEEKLEKL